MTKELTSLQRSELIEQYVELVVDNMDIKTMMQHITDDLTDYYSDYSDDELKDQIEMTHDEELYDELVDNVTNDESAEEVAHCIVDTNGAYAECVDRMVDSMGKE